MRIYDKNDDKTLKYLSLFLTIDEAKHIRDYLNQVIQKPLEKGEHGHIHSSDFNKEILITFYDPKASLVGWDERAKRIIEKDE